MKKYLFLLLCLTVSSARLSAQDTDESQKLFIKAHQSLPNNVAEAEKAARLLLQKSLKEKSSEYTAKAYFLLGVSKYYDSKYYLSNKYYTEALATDYARTDLKFAEFCYNNRGTNFDFLNQLPQAISDYNKSLKLAEKRGDSSSIAQTWINIALLDSKTSNYAAARKKTLQALAYFSRHKDSLNMALCHQNLATFFMAQKKPALALPPGYKALELHEAGNYTLGTAQVLYNLGEAYSELDMFDESDEVLQRALKLSDEANFEMHSITGYVYLQLAKNNIKRGNYQNVEEYLEKSYALLGKKGIAENMNGYYFTKGLYYAKTGNFDAYLKNFKLFEDYLLEEETNTSAERYRELQALYDYEGREARIKQQGQELSSQRYKLWAMAILLVVVIAAAAIVLRYYYKMRSYVRQLYKSNMQEAAGVPFATVAEVSGEKLAELYNEILKLMDNERLYLQPGLTLTDLSTRLGTNDKYISQAINTYSNSNFSTFLNKYRVNYAKKILIANGSRIPLKAVSIESGFSSHSTFYRQFKEFTGLTPSQFMDISQENLMRVPLRPV